MSKQPQIGDIWEYRQNVSGNDNVSLRRFMVLDNHPNKCFQVLILHDNTGFNGLHRFPVLSKQSIHIDDFAYFYDFVASC